MDLTLKFKNVKVLVVGDVMLDRYWWGEVTRISPEAPVPVVRLNKTSVAPGGAANVASNIAGLGAIPILLGCVGKDNEAEELCEAISESWISGNALIRVSARRTTVKTRVIAHGQQVARIDQESSEPLNATDQKLISDSFDQLIDAEGADAIAISDYAKGFLSEGLLEQIISTGQQLGIPVVVDPKGRDYSRYKGATLLTPNRREAALACNIDEHRPDAVQTAGQQLLSELQLDGVLITEGEDGMTLFERGKPLAHLDASAREVYDVTGAGDTVIAVLAASLGAGLLVGEAAKIANAAAGIVVAKIGTAAVTIESIQTSLAEQFIQAGQ